MIKIYIFIFLAFLIQYDTFAQKFGYVDVSYVLKQMPEYQKAQLEIDNLGKKWKKRNFNKKRRSGNTLCQPKCRRNIIN